MANITIPGQAAKKETVYSGPPLPPKPGTAYNGSPRPASAATTTGGTVYSGPAPGTGVHGTVYNPRQAAIPGTQAPAHSAAARGGNLFFLIAALSVLNTFLILARAPFVMALGLAVTRIFGPDAPMANILFLNVMAVGVVVLLGVFVRHGSKPALLIGMLLYAADALLFFFVGNAALHIPSIIVHGIFMVLMFKTLSQLES
jgi:hypothetical protein